MGSMAMDLLMKFCEQAKGITVDTFIAKQEDLVNRFESGSFGYRGLQGQLWWQD